ncbi:MAG: hypothetical protein ACRDN8_10095, partial [Thermoleophilaceae bacterium]
ERGCNFPALDVAIRIEDDRSPHDQQSTARIPGAYVPDLAGVRSAERLLRSRRVEVQVVDGLYWEKLAAVFVQLLVVLDPEIEQRVAVD